MKVLQENPNGSTIIELGMDESAIFFDKEGGHEALSAVDDDGDGDGDDEMTKPSAVEMSIALIALIDPNVRALIEERISDA